MKSLCLCYLININLLFGGYTPHTSIPITERVLFGNEHFLAGSNVIIAPEKVFEKIQNNIPDAQNITFAFYGFTGDEDTLSIFSDIDLLAYNRAESLYELCKANRLFPKSALLHLAADKTYMNPKQGLPQSTRGAIIEFHYEVTNPYYQPQNKNLTALQLLALISVGVFSITVLCLATIKKNNMKPIFIFLLTLTYFTSANTNDTLNDIIKFSKTKNYKQFSPDKFIPSNTPNKNLQYIIKAIKNSPLTLDEIGGSGDIVLDIAMTHCLYLLSRNENGIKTLVDLSQDKDISWDAGHSLLLTDAMTKCGKSALPYLEAIKSKNHQIKRSIKLIKSGSNTAF